MTDFTTDTKSSYPRVSIVTPVYNGAQTIRRTIESIRAQHYPNIEHIVMDAASTDETLDIVRAYPDSLTWYSEKDAGQSDALNKGFARTTGQYLTWLNADDFLRPGAIQKCLDLFAENPGIALAYGRIDRVNQQGGYLHDDYTVYDGTRDDLLCGDNFISQPGNLFTREAWETCGPLRVDLHYCMDWDLWIKIMAKYPIKYTPQVFAAQGYYPQTKSSSGGLGRFHEIREMIEGHGGGAANTYYKIGLWYYQHGQMAEARHYLKIALQRGPKPQFHRRAITLMLKSFLGATVINNARRFRESLSSRVSKPKKADS
jgi:glycosyltransferase involved in cell wall biosynthesis